VKIERIVEGARDEARDERRDAAKAFRRREARAENCSSASLQRGRAYTPDDRERLVRDGSARDT